MNVEELREYCLSKEFTTESTPFDDVTLVYKVHGKMFALISIDNDNRIALKTDPDEGIALREHYDFILPAYHFNKTHWISVDFKICNADLLISLIDKSYTLVFNKLPLKIRKGTI